MDIIQNILDERNDNFKIDKFNCDTWEKFHMARKNKSLFLMGIGIGADFFLENYTDNMVGIIDNDKKKQGLPIDLYVNEAVSDNCEKKTVLDVSILENYKNDDVIILITNLKACEEIAEQLEGLGISNYFSLLAMEAIRRKFSNEVKVLSTNNTTRPEKSKIKPNKIVFYTMGSYSGHGKYIAEQLLKLRKDLELVWIINDIKLEVPKGIRLVYGKNRKKYLPELETAKIWVYDDMLPLEIQKSPEQIYIQVKHWSSVTLKTFGFDLTEFRNEAGQIAVCKHNSELMDYVITGSNFDTQTCRRGFGFQGKVVELGSPRSDALFKEEILKNKVYNYFNIDFNKKVLLYAPTFRCKQGVYYKPEAYDPNLDCEKLVKELINRFSSQWIILLRLHHIVAEASKNIKKPNYVIDASDYPDSQELVAASDIMITDYSSIMFEPAFVRKPVFLFAPDRKEYINGERKLLIDYDSLPFSIAESNEELVENMESFNEEEYIRKVDEFMEKYGVHEDGHASDRAAKFISDLIDGKRS
jgi:CDP-glycerol glycerophosphotransferase (TagB/SpsB family)